MMHNYEDVGLRAGIYFVYEDGHVYVCVLHEDPHDESMQHGFIFIYYIRAVHHCPGIRFSGYAPDHICINMYEHYYTS